MAPVAATSRACCRRVSARLSPGPAAEFHAEHHRLSMNAVGTTHAQGVLEFKRTALAGFAELLHVVQNDVERLGDLVAQRGVAQVGASHAIVHPTAGLFFAFGNSASIYSAMFVRNAMTSWLVTSSISSNSIDGEVGVVANPLCVFLGDAALPQLGLGLACEQLDFLPNVELVLKREDAPFRDGCSDRSCGSSCAVAAGRRVFCTTL